LSGPPGSEPTLAAPPAQPGTDETLTAAPAAPTAPARDATPPALPFVDPATYARGPEIARGGMGRIVEARDRRLGRAVAVKELLHPAPEAARRFEREALISAQLQHPAIVAIYEAGRWPTGEPFFAMKRVLGESLDKRVARATTLDQRLALIPSVLAVFDALAYAHSKQIIHRDLKPANVLVGEFGETVVIDWGLAKDLATAPDEDDAPSQPYRDAAPDQTVAGAVMGTPAYMSPEQARGDRVDARTDVYALGALLYHVLAGAPPYAGPSAHLILADVLAAAPPPIRDRVAGVPADLAAILDKAMARDPAARYPTAQGLADDLRRFQTGQLVGAHAYSRVALVRRWLRRHRALAATVFAATLIATAGASWFLVRERGLRADAEAARDLATASDQQSQRNLAWGLVEQGRQEHLARHPARAIAYLAAAYPTLATEPMVRLLVGAATRDLARLQLTLRGHTAAVNAVAFSPDGRRLVTASDDRTARIWDVASGASLRTLEGHREMVISAAFSSDGRRVVTASRDYVARLWDADAGTLIAELVPAGHRAQAANVVAPAEFSHDGRYVVTATDDHTACVWDGHTGALVAALANPDAARAMITSATFSPDGRAVATASLAGTLRLWDLPSGAPRATAQSTSGLTSARFSQDGSQLLTEAQDGDVRMWSPGSLTSTLVAEDAALPNVTTATLSPDGRYLVHANPDETLTLHDQQDGDTTLPIHVPRTGHPGTVAFSADSRTLVTADADFVMLWRAATAEPVAILDGHGGEPNVAAFSADGQRVAVASVDRTVTIWDARYADAATSATPAQALALTAAGGRLLTIDDLPSDAPQRAVHLWDVGTGAEIMRTPRGASDDLAPALSRDGARLVLAGDDHTARVLDAATGRPLATLAGHLDQVVAADFRGDGRRVVTASKDYTARIWDAETGRSLVTLVGHTEPPFAAIFSPDGRRVATISGETARIWDAETGRLDAILEHQLPLSDVAFSPDSQRLLTGGAEATLWDLATREVVAKLPGDAGHVTFSPDGHLILTASDRVVSIWDTRTARLLDVRAGVPDADAARFSPDGAGFVTATPAHTLLRWDLRLEARTPAEVAAFAADRSRWTVIDGHLVPRR
jgi:WD40 repeat protein